MLLNIDPYSKLNKHSCHWFICPECKQRICSIMSLYLSTTSNPMIKLKCDCSKDVFNISVKDYLNTSFNIVNCKNHSNKEGRFFCVKCCTWLCKDCDTAHSLSNPGHIKYISKDIITEQCKTHLQNALLSYCKTCSLPICKKCIDEGLHLTHDVEDLTSIWNSVHFNLKYKSNDTLAQFFKEQIKLLESQKTQHLSAINQVMFLLEKCKANIENEYQKALKMNTILFELIEIVYWDFLASQHTPNLNIIKNIQMINLKPFDKETIDIRKEIKNIAEEINKIQKTNTVFYQKTILLYDNEEQINQSQKKKKARKLHINYNTCFYIKCSATLTEHTNAVYSIIQLSNGRIASASSDNTIKIWTLSTNTCISTLKGHTNTVWSICQLDDGRLASASDDKSIKIWNLTTEQSELDLLGHNDAVLVVVQLINKTLASGSYDQTIKVWNIQLKTFVQTLNGHTSNIFSIIELNDGNLASGAYDNTIRIWNLSTSQCINTLRGHKSYCWSIIQLFDSTIASGSTDTTIKIWEVDGKESIKTLTGHTFSVIALIQLKNGSLVSGSYDSTIKIWSLESNQCITTLIGHNNAVWGLLQLIDGKLLSASWDKAIKIWE